MNKMMITAAAGLMLVAGNAEAVDVTKWKGEDPRVEVLWDATLQSWTQEARDSGDKFASPAYTAKTLGIWGSEAHSTYFAFLSP
jgi:hypothetical protein